MHRLPLKTSLALVLAATLTACASSGGLAPPSERQSSDRFEASRALAEGALSRADWPAEKWWSAFGDPQLDSLIAEALAQSPGIEAANARVRKAMAEAGLAEAAIHPTLGASAQESHLLLPETLAPAPIGGELRHTTILSLDFKWAPDIWGKAHAKHDAAIGAARALEVDAQAARLTLVQNIALTYAALDQVWALRDVAQADVSRNAQLKGLQAQRFKSGLDNKIGLTQTTAAEAQARQQVAALDRQITALKTALAFLAGQGPDRGLSIARPKLTLAAVGVPSVVPSELVSRRPDVVAARWRVEAASRNIAASKAAFYPSLNLSAMVGLAAGRLGDLFKSDAGLGYGGPAITLPILDGERLRNQLRISNAEFDLAIAGYDQAVLTGLRDIVDAIQSSRGTALELQRATEARDAASQATTLVRLRHKAGLATALDVLNAQRSVLLLDQQIAQLRARRIENAVKLDVALGGGLPVREADAGHAFDSTAAQRGNAQ